MTDEINKGCEFQSDCIEYKDISYLKIMPICAIHELSIACHDKVNKCKYFKLYKQLKRLEQKRDELKKTVENQKLEYEELQCDLSEVENACGCYQSENAKLKQENKELKDTADTMLMANDIKKQDIDSLREANDRLEQENKELKTLNEKICEDWEKEIKVYWNALEEIREINKLFFERKYGYPEDLIKIDNIINEVLNE